MHQFWPFSSLTHHLLFLPMRTAQSNFVLVVAKAHSSDLAMNFLLVSAFVAEHSVLLQNSECGLRTQLQVCLHLWCFCFFLRLLILCSSVCSCYLAGKHFQLCLLLYFLARSLATPPALELLLSPNLAALLHLFLMPPSSRLPSFPLHLDLVT